MAQGRGNNPADKKTTPAPMIFLDEEGPFRRNESDTDVEEQGAANREDPTHKALGQTDEDQASVAQEGGEEKAAATAEGSFRAPEQAPESYQTQQQPKQSSIWDNLSKAVAVTGGAAYAALYATAAVGFFVATFPVGLAAAGVGIAAVGAVMLFNKIFKKSKPAQAAQASHPSNGGQAQEGDEAMQEKVPQKSQERATRMSEAVAAKAAALGGNSVYAPGSSSGAHSHAPSHTPSQTFRDPTAPKMFGR